MRKLWFTYLLATMIFSAGSSSAQPSAVPFGLDDFDVRDLAISAHPLPTGRYLYAVTDSRGVYRRNLAHPDSGWIYLGLSGKDLRSIALYRWGVGPWDFEIPLVGAHPRSLNDPLIYSLTDSGWIAADSGIDRASTREIRALAAFGSGGHMPPPPAFAAGGGTVYYTPSPRFQWVPVLEIGMGVVNSLRVEDPAAQCGGVWAGGENAIFAPWIARSADCGQSWELSLPSLGGDNACDALALHPSRPNVVFAGMEGTVIVSRDSGRTWNRTTLRDQPVYFFGMAVASDNPQHIWAGGATSPENHWALWESFDDGLSWQPVRAQDAESPAGISSIVADPLQPGTVYIGTSGDGVWTYRSRYSWDAVLIALQVQRQGIRLDSLLLGEIDRSLGLARTAHDSLWAIHAFPHYVPTELLITSSATWTQNWSEGEVWTGFAPVDSLGREYGLERVEPNPAGSDHFVLRFSRPLRMPELARLYREIPGIQSAVPNTVGGDGDRIEAFKKGGIWHFAFSHGWGDCPSGCIHRKYWYVVVKPDGQAELVRVWERDFSVPRIHLWNIPHRYPATVFTDLQSLYDALESPDWWVRRHAVEVCGLLFEHQTPWLSEDEANRGSFDQLRTEVVSHKESVLAKLQEATGDEDPDVRHSARGAINRLLGFQAESYQLYFPLHVGNRWEFQGSRVWAVQDTVRIDSLTYFRLTGSNLAQECLLRFTEDGKLVARHGDSLQVWLDFGASVGQTWTVQDQTGRLAWTVELQSKSDTVAVPAGTFVGCYRFWYHFRGADNDWVEWYAPGIGPVKLMQIGFVVIEMPLVSAHVAGISHPTSVETGQTDGRTPMIFELLPGYPNPSRGRVILRYVLPRADKATIRVFDIRGRLVRTFELGPQKMGKHSVVWDARDETGKPVAAGVYVVQLRAGENSVNRKVLLLR